MTTKINSISIRGIRGIKEEFTLPLEGKSMLLYGDNGTGKSSISDAFEWVYYDQIDHLSNEEIGRRKGKDAIRNVFLKSTDEATIKLGYNNRKLDCTISIDGKLNANNSNTSNTFQSYINSSYSENLILRYRDIIHFIIASKKEKLDKLQQIIGFGEVGKLRDDLKRNAGRIKRNINSENFINKKSAQQAILLEHLGANAYDDQQFFKAVANVLKPLNLNIKIDSLQTISNILRQIETKGDSDIVDSVDFLTEVTEILTETLETTEEINNAYKKYFSFRNKLNKDADKIGKLQILGLLNEGLSVLRADVLKSNFCPLCLQEKSKIQLIKELNSRIDDLEEINSEWSELDELKGELTDTIENISGSIQEIAKSKKIRNYSLLSNKLNNLCTVLNKLEHELEKEIISKKTLLEPASLIIDKKEIKELVQFCNSLIKDLEVQQKKNTKLIVYSRLLQSLEAYKSYVRLDRHHKILTSQQVTFENLFLDFIRRQEEALAAFLELFSNDINNFYVAMNPKEKVEDIRLVPLKDKNDELVGITIEYTFFNKTRTQPMAYLSESHINCLGLAFYLASVRAFNKQNKFFVLDDVISSFDRSHRARFAKVLVEQFTDYQILLLTHEKDFFDLVSSDVKSKGWLIQQIGWTPEKGTGLEKMTIDHKERIKKKLDEGNVDGLGNDIRIYTERVLKEVAVNIEAYVPFRFNDINEKRMAPELLDSIQKRLSEKSAELKSLADIPKIKGIPLFIGNTASHDNDFTACIEDFEVMWEDIGKLIKLFYCGNCNKFVSVRTMDKLLGKIRCSCKSDGLIYNWK